MAITRLTAGLGYDRRGGSSVVLAEGDPILQMRRDGVRARIDLVLLNGERTIEVSFQPAAADRVVRERARRCRADANGWAGALAAALRDDAVRWGLTTTDGPDLVRLLGALAHPTLAEAYAEGAGTAEEVPRWVAPALRAGSVADAAATLFAPVAVTRSLVRATAEALVQLPASWWLLALAAAAAGLVEPDDLVRCLEGAPPAPSSGPAPGSTHLPAGEEVRGLRDGLRLVGRGLARRLVAEAAGTATVPALATTLRLLLEVQRDVRWPLPSSRGELERVCLLAAAIDPDPGRPRPRSAAAPATTSDTRPRPPRPAFEVARVAPAVRTPAPPPGRELRHGELARALAVPNVDGRYDLVLPRSGAELATWGRLLGNCLGDFAAAVAAGATIVVGVRDQGLLVAAAEVRGRQLVQLLGARNRPVPRRLAVAVVAHVDAVAASSS